MRIGPRDFEATETTVLFRTVFPAGHYFINGSPFSTIRYLMWQWQEQGIRSEQVTVSHPQYLDGGGHEPTVVWATPARVALRCEVESKG